MKTAYELAMERLNKSAPVAKLSPAQRKQLAELDSKYAAKIAEREISIGDEISRATCESDFEKVEKLQQQLIVERKALQEELESQKEQIRSNDALR